MKNSKKAKDILDRFWSDKMSLVWDLQDIHSAANEREVALTNQEAITVLQELHHHHDPQLGIRWVDLPSYNEEYALGRKLTLSAAPLKQPALSDGGFDGLTDLLHLKSAHGNGTVLKAAAGQLTYANPLASDSALGLRGCVWKSTATTLGCFMLCGFSFHCFSQSSSEGTVTSACFE